MSDDRKSKARGGLIVFLAAGSMCALIAIMTIVAVPGCDETNAQTEDDPYGENVVEDDPYGEAGAGENAGDAAKTPETSGGAAEAVEDGYSDVYPKWHTRNPGEYLDYNQRASLIQRGKLVYDKYCVGCHGVNGDGKGPAAIRLITQPRDFTSGIYKFRSTDSSSLPMEADLHRTLTRGLSQVSMPAFPLMPERDLVAVIEYIKAFYPRWEERKDERVIVPVPRAPADLMTESRIKRGQVVYTVMQCGKCHGTDGAGKGATQTAYVDAWGNPQRPFNFTRGKLKGGDDPEDIYRTFHTGLISVMPAYGVDTLSTVNVESFQAVNSVLSAEEIKSLEPVLKDFAVDGAALFSEKTELERTELGVRNSWDLVAYVISLRKNISTTEAVLGPPLSKNGDGQKDK